MIIRTQAQARAGLIGNPSDGYFGKTISVIMHNFRAEVTLYEAPRLTILPRGDDRLEFESVASLADDVRVHGYYGGIRLIKAAIKTFYDHCRQRGVDLDDRCFNIEYRTNIPVRVGLAGSSAIVTATMRALMNFFGVEIPRPVLPNVILDVELRELKIGAGLQDRVIQVYGGAVFMDFDREMMDRRGYGEYEPLDPAALPPLFVAFHSGLAEGTEVVHNDLRSRFNRQDPEVLEGIEQWARLAQEARDLIVAGRGAEIGPLMDQNFELRSRLCQISPGNRRLVEAGKSQGAAVKFAGSGGAVIGAYDGDPERLGRLRQAYQEMGATLLTPQTQPDTSSHA